MAQKKVVLRNSVSLSWQKTQDHVVCRACRACLALSTNVRFVKIGLVEADLWIWRDLDALFVAFLVEETLGNFDFRILRVSISLGTKFQRNWPVLIRAQAGLRKGVDASAISSVQTVWWGRSRLILAWHSFLASAELLRWRLRTKNGKPSDRLCRRTTHVLGLPLVGQQVQGLAFNGSSD